MAFTKEKINSNPFNFSPYHFRSKYIAEKYREELVKMEDPNLRREIIEYGMPKGVFD